MVEKLVPDGLWALVFLLIPPRPPRPRGGRPPLHPRRVLAGILYILRCGLPWRQLPTALGFGSGITCERASIAGMPRASGLSSSSTCSTMRPCTINSIGLERR